MIKKQIENSFYINSLDGIRACAVTLVFVSHSGIHKGIPGGFGVTVFFFLSGFLITTLLRREFEKTNRISFKGFYLRRIYRIFPPLYIVLILVLVISFVGIVPHNMKIGAVASQFVHFTNYYYVIWGKQHMAPGTGVLWSLAVEEHFYLVFPFGFLMLVRYFNYKKIALIILGLCALVLIWRCYLVFSANIPYTYTYRATDARIDSIMFGCILGVWSNPVLDEDVSNNTAMEIVVLCVSFAVLFFCFIYRGEEFRHTFRYTLQGLALFPLFYLAVRRSHWFMFSWLNWNIVRGLGVISYTFYLFHLTGLKLAEIIGADSIEGRMILGFLITFSFSTLMYQFIEKPCAMLRRKLHVEN